MKKDANGTIVGVTAKAPFGYGACGTCGCKNVHLTADGRLAVHGSTVTMSLCSGGCSHPMHDSDCNSGCPSPLAPQVIKVETPRFFCMAKRCTNPAAPDVHGRGEKWAEITCPTCGRAYQRCADHGGQAAARRSLASHKGLTHYQPTR